MVWICGAKLLSSPSLCLDHSEMLFECSVGRDPFSRDVLGLHRYVSISAPSHLHTALFLCTLVPHLHPERIHTHTHAHTQTNLLGQMKLIDSPCLRGCGSNAGGPLGFLDSPTGSVGVCVA